MREKMIVFLFCQVLLNHSAYAHERVNVTEIVKANTNAVVAVVMPKNSSLDADISGNSDIYGKKYVLGSGFIISEDGYVVTNAHVIESDSQIKVRFKNMQVLPATLVGADEVTDIALLKINNTGMHKVKIGSSAELEIGDVVIAMGSPFGLAQSVTTGIVSAKELIVPRKGNIPFILTDTVLNEGNSGGPLFDHHGMVVGVNSWIYTNSDRYQGMSFAIPIDLTMTVVEQLKKTGKILHGWIGIKTENASLSLPRVHGAVILSFASTSPAKNAGLRIGDIVVAFNQQLVENSEDLASKVKSTPVDTWVDFEIIRHGERQIIKVKTGHNSKS